MYKRFTHDNWKHIHGQMDANLQCLISARGKHHQTMPCARVEAGKVKPQLEIARVEAPKMAPTIGLLLKCGYKICLIRWFCACAGSIR